MKRASLVAYDEASPEVQVIYDEIMDTMGSAKVLNFCGLSATTRTYCERCGRC